MISIITASHNEFKNLKNLYQELNNILSSEINWIIKDSGECKKTFNYFKQLNHKQIFFLNNTDTGIYNAMNIALKYAAEYYIVLGADDNLNVNTLKEVIKENTYKDSDINIFSVMKDRHILVPRKNSKIWYSISNVIASHSVGLIIKTNIHKKFGLYDETYKILADSKLLATAIIRGATINYDERILGNFSSTGVSSKLSWQRIFEAYRYNIEIGNKVFLQPVFFIFRSINLFLKQLKILK
jgi:hypothetical protein